MPVDELKMFDFDTSVNHLSGDARVQTWTARGYLDVYGNSADARALHMALRLAFGHRRSPVMQRAGSVMLIRLAVALVVIAVCAYFKVV